MVYDNVSPELVIAAINTSCLPDYFVSAPYNGHKNSFGMTLYGNAVFWEGYGGITVVYNEAKMEFIRKVVYYRMPSAQYMNNEQLLHHYFTYLTPVNLLADASLQVTRVNAKTINLNSLN